MVNATMEDVRVWQNKTVYDSTGDKVGKIDDVYFDEETGRPEWALVTTGMFGARQHFIPLTHEQERTSGDSITIQWTKDQVKDAPSVEPDGDLSESEERQLYDYYGLDWQQSDSPTQYAGQRQQPTGQMPQGRQQGAPDAMTRSEEEIEIERGVPGETRHRDEE